MILIYSESYILSLSSGSVWSRCLKEMSPIWTPPIWTRHQTEGPSLPQERIALKRWPLLLLVCRCPCATWRRVRMKRKSQSKAGMEIQSSSLYRIIECVLCREYMYTLNLSINPTVVTSIGMHMSECIVNVFMHSLLLFVFLYVVVICSLGVSLYLSVLRYYLI